VRAEARAAQQTGLDREADELERMMKDLAVQQQQQEDVTARRFAERSIKLWAVSSAKRIGHPRD
jgi:hypothetical protein